MLEDAKSKPRTVATFVMALTSLLDLIQVYTNYCTDIRGLKISIYVLLLVVFTKISQIQLCELRVSGE
jgi:hypothetical protein